MFREGCTEKLCGAAEEDKNGSGDIINIKGAVEDECECVPSVENFSRLRRICGNTR